MQYNMLIKGKVVNMDLSIIANDEQLFPVMEMASGG